ncbi:MAG: hypothetical protein JXQ83_05190 [Candidatus Glassbacteria bacterium]|nr:hypothetical protein [Candidatus Glassbacteria bacterium]
MLCLFLPAIAGCAAGMQKRLPGMAVPPEEVVEALKRLDDHLNTDKQIFRVRLLDKGRTFSGDGALVYRSPDTLQMSIYGPPFTTLWMQLLSRGDSITVVLPKDNRVVRAMRSDTREIAELANSRGLTDGEFLGGVTGVYQIERFLHPGTEAEAAAEGQILRLRLLDDQTVCEFVYDKGLEAVVRFVRYRKGRLSREIIRSDFEEVQGMKRPRKTVYRDYLADREITVLVGKEEINPDLEDSSFEIILPEGS